MANKISEETLLFVIKKSLPLFERAKSENNSQRPSTVIVTDDQLEQWMKIVAHSNPGLFKKRLMWDNLCLNTFLDISEASINATPPWITIFKSYLHTMDSLGQGSGLNDFKKDLAITSLEEPFPFEDILLPFVYVAKKELEQRGKYKKYVNENCQKKLERNLLKSLFRISAQCFQLEFSIHRSSNLNKYEIFSIDSDTRSSKLYNEFVENLLNGRLIDFFVEYPVLARLLSTRASHWINAIDELLIRLESGFCEITKQLNGGTPPGNIANIDLEISDYHNNGRFVTILTFDCGLKVVYKPRNASIESAYNHLLSWFNENSAPFKLKTFKIIDYEDHSWAEFVECCIPADKGQTKRYYKSAGALLCVTYILNAIDLHYENVIQHADSPVLIDLETLLHPSINLNDHLNGSPKDANALAVNKLFNSVIGTGLMPRWQLSPHGLYDSSAFGFTMPKSVDQPGWLNINSDSMSFKHADVKTHSVERPLTTNMNLSQNINEIIEGFSAMYRFIYKKRDLLSAENSPLIKFKNKKIRIVFRNTNVYFSIQSKLMNPKFMRDGVERSIQLDILSRDLLKSETKPAIWPIINAERVSLENLDIPIFYGNSDIKHLNIFEGESINNFFDETSYDVLLRKVKSLSENDLELQSNLIKGSVFSNKHFNIHTSDPEGNLNAESCKDFVSEQRLIREAKSLALILKKNSIPIDKLGLTWISPQYFPENKCFQVTPLSYSLYGGTSGIALFFAALAHITQNEEYKQLSVKCLHSFEKIIESRMPDSASELFGGALGFCSLLYPLATISKFLQEPIFVKYALEVASFVSEESISKDRKYDIISGAAGTILGLLSVYNHCKDPEIIKFANWCGHHLINSRQITTSGYRAWGNDNGRFLTGFSHGAAGIAYALLRLYQLTNYNDYLNAAAEAIMYEQSLYNQDKGNWPDLSSDNGNPFVCFWCNGAPGIGLARLAGSAVLNTPAIQNDIDNALKTTSESPVTNLDHLCCGNLGRLEFLLQAQLQKSDNDHINSIITRNVTSIIYGAQKRGNYNYGDCLTFVPGFFQGAAGIGYELLRLAKPDRIKSALTWE